MVNYSGHILADIFINIEDPKREKCKTLMINQTINETSLMKTRCVFTIKENRDLVSKVSYTKFLLLGFIRKEQLQKIPPLRNGWTVIVHFEDIFWTYNCRKNLQRVFPYLPYAEVKIFFLAAISKIPGDNWSKSSFGAQPWVLCVLQEEDVVVKRILLLDKMVGQITGLNRAMKTDVLSRTTH